MYILYTKHACPSERHPAWHQQDVSPALLSDIGMRFDSMYSLMKNTDLSYIEEFIKILPRDDPEVIKILVQTIEPLNKYLNPGKIEENKIPDSVTRFITWFAESSPPCSRSLSGR